MICLPKAHGLDSLHLIATTLGLVLWVVIVELWGVTNPGHSSFKQKSKTKYIVTCKVSKKDMEEVVRHGRVIEGQGARVSRYGLSNI